MHILFKDQYKFVYDSLEEFITCEKTWFAVADLSLILKNKDKRESSTKLNAYQKEFAQICKQTSKYFSFY